MLITKIVGGLGNQMFQYAMAKSLAIECGVKLRVDCSAFRNRRYVNPEGYLLDEVFGILETEATLFDYVRTLGFSSVAIPLIRRGRIPTLAGSSVFKESRVFHYEERLLSDCKPDAAYVLGYWQSERYFARYADTIRTVFQFRPRKLSARAILLANEIKESNAVSLHVRRGDYVSHPVYSNIYEVCEMNYYRQAMALINSRLPGAIYYVFTDDVAWVRAQPEFSNCIISTNEVEGSWNDLYLMSQCKHHVIANSSFSWWGAWLNPNHEKLVVAPAIWFKDGTVTKDLLPKSWIII